MVNVSLARAAPQPGSVDVEGDPAARGAAPSE